MSHCWFEGDLVLWTEVHSKGHLRLAETRETGEWTCELLEVKLTNKDSRAVHHLRDISDTMRYVVKTFSTMEM